jgi:RNA polymerase sigma factor (sigma-70 family)
MQYRVMDAMAPSTEHTLNSLQPRSARGVVALDARSFQLVYEDFRASIFRYVVSRIGPVAAEDVTAEVFVAAWRSRDRYDASHHDGNIEPWLMGIATNIISRHRSTERRWLEACRRGALVVEGVDDADDADARVDASLRHGRLLSALAHIPKRERIPLMMHVVSGMDYEAVAAALGVPAGTVRSRISRGRARLRERMQGPGVER